MACNGKVTDDQVDERDVVEDFARQLDQLCTLNPMASNSFSDNESDDEAYDAIPEGYQPLPQDEDEGVDMAMEESVNGDDPMSEENPHASIVAQPLTVTLDPAESIPEETASMIKNIMAGITLSDSAVPDWAKSIPESAWLPRVGQRNNENANDDR